MSRARNAYARAGQNFPLHAAPHKGYTHETANIRFYPARRRAGGKYLLFGGRQGQGHRRAGQAGRRLHRGGQPLLEPGRDAVLPAHPRHEAAKRADRGLRLHPPQGRFRRGRRQFEVAFSGGHRLCGHLRKEPYPPRHGRLKGHARRKSGDDLRQRSLPLLAGEAGHL